VVSRSQKKEAAKLVTPVIGERRACKITGISRTAYRHKKMIKDQELRNLIYEIAMKHRKYGYRQIHRYVSKTNIVNIKKIYRIYLEMGLKYRIKNRKKRIQLNQIPIRLPNNSNIRWSMDFMSDSLYDGRRFRILNIIDDFSREAVKMKVGFSITGFQLVRIFEKLKSLRKLPDQIVVDNGPEFTSKIFLRWASENNVDIHFIEKGKPTQNAFVESFNGKVRTECLNEHWFKNIHEAENIIENWRTYFNTERPHSSLNGLSPLEYLEKTA